MYDVSRCQNHFCGGLLTSIQMLLLLGMCHRCLNRHDLLGASLSLPHLAKDFSLSTDGLGSCELPSRIMLLSGYLLELTAGDTSLEPGSNLRIGCFTHAAP